MACFHLHVTTGHSRGDMGEYLGCILEDTSGLWYNCVVPSVGLGEEFHCDLLASGPADDPSHSGVWKTPAGSDRRCRENAEKETVLSGKMPTGGQATSGGDSESCVSSLNLRKL